jgi:hypothetical protein
MKAVILKARFIKTRFCYIFKNRFGQNQSTFCMHYAKTKFQRKSKTESQCQNSTTLFLQLFSLH